MIYNFNNFSSRSLGPSPQGIINGNSFFGPASYYYGITFNTIGLSKRLFRQVYGKESCCHIRNKLRKLRPNETCDADCDGQIKLEIDGEYECLGDTGTWKYSVRVEYVQFFNRTDSVLLLSQRSVDPSGGGYRRRLYIPPCSTLSVLFVRPSLECWSWQPVVQGQLPTVDFDFCDSDSDPTPNQITISGVTTSYPNSPLESSLLSINSSKNIDGGNLIFTETLPDNIYLKIITSIIDTNDEYNVSATLTLSTVENPGSHPTFGPWNVVDGASGSATINKSTAFGSTINISLQQIPTGPGNSIYGLGQYDLSNATLSIKF